MKILWLGDFFYDYDYISDDIKEIGKWIKENNYKTILNLEGTIDCENYKKIEKRGPNLSSNIIAIDVLKELNVIGVTLANNHMMDFGAKGLNHTIKLLDDNKILHAGAGKNLEEALKPMVIKDKNESIAIYSFGWDIEETIYANDNTSGCAPRDKELFCKIIKNSKKKYDKIAVCPHWGFEYNRLPMPYDIDLAHSLIDSDCDLIIGNHPHCVQPFEVYKDKRIYYALGNFYFSSRRKKFHKSFKERISNQSDYGIMVGYDSKNNSYKEYIIEYSHEHDKSSIIDYNNKIIRELTKSEIDNHNYYNKVKQNKININPILTTNKKKNSKKIRWLFMKYKLKRIIKCILRKNKHNKVNKNNSKKIKIAYLTKNFRINGVSNVIMNYALNLDKEKYDITILAAKPICEDYINQLNQAGVNFIEIPDKKGKNPFKYYLKLCSIINKKNFDIVHIHGNSATIALELIILSLKRIKVRIAHCHNTKCSNPKIHKLLKPLVSKLYSYGFACSDDAGKWMFGKHKFTVLPNGFDTTKFTFDEKNRQEVRKSLGLSNDSYLIGHVGIFSDQKNHLFMLKVFEQYAKINDKAYMIFIGDGSNRNKIEEFISSSKYGNRVICYGETTNVKKMYDAMDLFFFPSKFEGLGIVLLEAQINGLRCVISKSIPQKAILNKDNVAALSLDEKYKTWCKELDNPTKIKDRKKYYANNIEAIKKFDIYTNVNLLEDIYFNLMKGK